MTFHPERYLGPGFLLLVLCVGAPSVADELRTNFQLPVGYGAEGDRRRASRVPALVRPTVGELSAGAEGNWVKESVENGAWVYELHVSKDGTEAVTRITSNGNVMPPKVQEPEPCEPAGAGE